MIYLNGGLLLESSLFNRGGELFDELYKDLEELIFEFLVCLIRCIIGVLLFVMVDICKIKIIIRICRCCWKVDEIFFFFLEKDVFI